MIPTHRPSSPPGCGRSAQRAGHAAEDGRDSLEPSLAQRLGVRPPATTFATTEHFNLQTARSTTVSAANGRASIYLAALSSNLIALAFIGQLSRLGAAFYAFALILLPVLVFVGLVTFLRLVQSSIEDIAYAHRIALLRDLYLGLVAELEPYVTASFSGSPVADEGDRRPERSVRSSEAVAETTHAIAFQPER